MALEGVYRVCIYLCYMLLSLCVRRVDLIDQDIERAVSRMQSVIELARYIRDIKVIPIKVQRTAYNVLRTSVY